MASLAQLLAARGSKQPWEAGQGVQPDQPAQGPIDPQALAASAAAPPQAPPGITTPSDEAMALADVLRRRQEAAATLGAQPSQALQDLPLTLGTLMDFLQGLFAGKSKEGK